MVKEKQHTVRDFLLYYNPLFYILGTWFALELRAPVFELAAFYFRASSGSIFYRLLKLIIYGGILGVWIYICFVRTRDLTYRKQTGGRGYLSDRMAYNRTYSWLVDFFRRADPHKLDTSKAPKGLKWMDACGIVIGKTDDNRLVYVPSDCESNLCTLGAPGSGKTRGHAIVNAMTFGGSVLAVDIKGDIYSYISKHSDRKILRFCPDDPDALETSSHFDPLAGYNNLSPTDKKIMLANMSIIIIPDEGGESGAYFTGRARKILRSISTYMLWENPDTSFADIVHAILLGNIFDWADKIAASDCLPAKELIMSLMDGNEKNAGGAYDTLTTALDFYSSDVLDVLLSNKHGKCLSVDDLEQGSDIYLQINQDHMKVYGPLFTLIIQSLMMQFMQREDSSSGVKKRPILFLLDEFPQLSFSYDMANTALSTLRSKGVVIDMLMQDRSQLEMKYTKEGARALIACCNYQLFLSSNDTESSKAYSELFGKKKTLVQNTSLTSKSDDNNTNGISIIQQEEDIYPPQVFGDLPDTNNMIVYFKGKHAMLHKIKAL